MSLADEIRAVLSDTMNLPQDFLNGMVQFQAQNQVPVKTLATPLFDVRDYGAARDGVTDDTNAIQSTINAWVTASNDSANGLQPVLVLPPGQYKTTAPLTISYAHNNISNKLISGYGAKLVPTFASGHAIDISTSAGQIRNLTIQGIFIDGTNLSDTTSSLIHLGGGSVGAFYRGVLRDVTLENAKGDGVLIDGQSYEHQFFGCHIDDGGGGNIIGSGIHIVNAAGGAVSSIDLYGGTISGFLHNVWAESPQGGLKIYGGTFLRAYNDGIFLANGSEAALFGCHVENAWQGGVASPSWTTSQAGITILGVGSVHHVYGTQNNNKMRYVVRSFASPQFMVSGGKIGAGCDYYLRAEGAAGCDHTWINLPTGVTGTVHDATPSTASNVQINSGTIGIRGSTGTQFGAVAVPYSASITQDASLGPWQTITATNATAFSIHAPINPPDANHTQELTLEVVNNTAGVLGTCSFNAIFLFSGLTWVNPGAGKRRRVTFRWNGNSWIATSISSADY